MQVLQLLTCDARAHGQTHAFSIATQPLHFAFQASTEIRSVSSLVLREHAALVVLREHAALVNRGPGSRRPALATSTGDQHWRPPPLHGHAPCACGNHCRLGGSLGARDGARERLRSSNGFQRLKGPSSTGAATVRSRRRRASCLDHADAHDNADAHDSVSAHDSVHDISPRKEEKSAPDQSSASVSIDCQAHSSDAGGATTGAPVSANLGTQSYSAAGRLASCRYGQTEPTRPY